MLLRHDARSLADTLRNATARSRQVRRCNVVPKGGRSMEILPNRPTEKGPPDRFIGDVWLDTIVRGEEPSRIRAAVVRFAPGARNAWHRHAVGQTLYVTEGIGRIQARAGDVTEI